MSSQAPRRRVFMVDVLRIIASLQMINGHTLDALLLPEWETGPTFDRYLWFRGLVSVAFLLVAGMAYYLATIRRFEAHKSNPDAVRRRFRRGVELIAIGFALSFPWGAFSGDPAIAQAAWDRFWTSDVLQCIGITLITLESMTLLFPKPAYVVGGAFVLATGLVAAAPWLDGLPVDGPLAFAMPWLSHQTGSPFPVAPWSAFMLGGVVIGAFVLPKGADTPLWSRLLRLGVVYALASAAYGWLQGTEVPFVTEATTYSARPIAVFDRLAGISLFLAALAVLCHPIRRLPRVLAIVSGETLAVYVIHLILLFHPPFALVAWLGRSSYSLAPSLVVSIAMIVTTTALTLLWHEQKKRGWLRTLRQRMVRTALGSKNRDARAAK